MIITCPKCGATAERMPTGFRKHREIPSQDLLSRCEIARERREAGETMGGDFDCPHMRRAIESATLSGRR